VSIRFFYKAFSRFFDPVLDLPSHWCRAGSVGNNPLLEASQHPVLKREF